VVPVFLVWFKKFTCRNIIFVGRFCTLNTPFNKNIFWHTLSLTLCHKFAISHSLKTGCDQLNQACVGPKLLITFVMYTVHPKAGKMECVSQCTYQMLIRELYICAPRLSTCTKQEHHFMCTTQRNCCDILLYFSKWSEISLHEIHLTPTVGMSDFIFQTIVKGKTITVYFNSWSLKFITQCVYLFN